jgi:hypothetical protein
MATLLKYRHLLHHSFLLLFLISQHFSLDRFNCHQMLADLVAREVHFSKSPSTQYAAYPVKLKSALLNCVVLLEIQSYKFL